jgi:hypothetical protein
LHFFNKETAEDEITVSAEDLALLNNSSDDEQPAPKSKAKTKRTNKRTTKTNPKSKNVRPIIDGAFFPYTIKKNVFDEHVLSIFEQLQIFENIESAHYEENCFVYACIQSNMFSDEEIDVMRYIIHGRRIPSRNVKLIAENLNCHFVINHYDEKKGTSRMKNQTKKMKSTGKKITNDKEVRLLLYKKHYMLWKKLPITQFYLKNMETINKRFPNDKNKYLIRAINKNGSVKYWDKGGVSVSKILNTMFQLNFFEPILEQDQNIISTTEYKNKLDDYIDLNYSEELCTRPIKNNTFIQHWSKIYYADFESDTTVQPHVSFMCCAVHRAKNNKDIVCKTFINHGSEKSYINSFLDYLESGSLIYFHNLKYDSCFIINNSMNYDIIKPIERNGKMMTMILKSKDDPKRILTFKDSFSMISKPLKSFGSMFQLDVSKEIIPYKIYTRENRHNKAMPFDVFLDAYMNEHPKACRDEIQKILRDSVVKADAFIGEGINNAKLDIMKYCKFYCMTDCIVLMEGLERFDADLQAVFDDNGVNMFHLSQYLSISSIGYALIKAYGCLDGVYELSGKPQNFILRCISGGRCMLANNEKIYVENSKIQDFDAVSLYPSAMSIMSGVPMGKPKVIPPNVSSDDLGEARRLQRSRLDNYSTYFVEININKLTCKSVKPYAFPLVFGKNPETGSNTFSNDYTGRFYCDKRALQDLEEYYEIDYDIIRGYYFDDGFNTLINEFIKKLFELRLVYKRENNPLQETIKLLLNSIYGRSILKPIDTIIDIIDADNEGDYIRVNYNYINGESYKKNNKCFYKRIKPINKHFNVPQFGVAVLSWSKYLMNRVICTAEQNGIDIFYTDTDSIHILEQDIDKLSKIFKQKYKQDLIGENLTQYHTDFIKINGKPSFSKTFIGLGKKSYLDVLMNENGETDYHIRLKGIPNQVILNHCERNDISVIDLYMNLLNNETVEFDLTDGSTCFKKTKCYEQITQDNFKRKIRFEGPYRNV